MVEPALLGWNAQKRAFSIFERLGTSYSRVNAEAFTARPLARTSRVRECVSKGRGAQIV
jgi:hypothetical protein